jgi:CTP synthase (UTP-ammonia lyase)
MSIEDADHEESNPNASIPFISKLSYSLVGADELIEILSGSLAYRVYGKGEALERYSCNYSLNPKYQAQVSQGKLKIVGRNVEGTARLIELEERRFFMASLFLPQMNSTPGSPHPIILKYLEEALKFRELRRDIESETTE